MKTIFHLILLLAVCAHSFAAETAIEATPKDGVYFTYTGYMTTVLELKDGHFRYWFESDPKGMPEPVYPLTGTFSVNENIVTLKHKDVYQPNWTFKTVDGALTLWRPDALKNYAAIEDKYLKQLHQYGLGSILTSSLSPAEELWTHRGPPSL